MKSVYVKAEATLLKMRGHLSCLFPSATKKKKLVDPLFGDAVVLFDFCKRKGAAPPADEWPDEVRAGLERALVDCDGDFFRSMAQAADHMRGLTGKRSSHAEHVSAMIYFAANHLEKTGEHPTKKQLIEGTHKLMVKMGKSAIYTDTPQLWTPIIASAGFGKSPTAKSEGTMKNHGQWSASRRKDK